MRFFSLSCRSLIPTYKVAVVGSGPSAFYTAYHVLSKKPETFNVTVDFFEKLPTPFGLSRYGVAPDHPEVKNCEDYLRTMMKDSPVRFFGNVKVGEDISLEDLEQSYHSICLAYGVDNDNSLNIPGSDNQQVIPARQFVNWYNGYPTDFQPPDLQEIEDVTIIGNGNVALDVARILLAPTDHWKPTDISEDALEVLKTSSVKNVNIVARRGLLESAFTTKEIRELLDLHKEGIKFIPIDDSLWEDFVPSINKLDRPNKRKFTTIQKHLNQQIDHPQKTWSLQYLKSPKEFVTENGKLTKTIFTKNQLVDGKVVAQDEQVEVKNELVILSIGYRGSPIPGMEDFFLEKESRLQNKGGRVKPGYYTSGWIKNGPKGIIASTMMDSFDTGFNMLEDLTKDEYLHGEKIDIVEKLPNAVTWDQWLKLDNFELEQGELKGKSRDKVNNIEKMLEIVHS